MMREGVNIPDAHSRTRNAREFDGSRETLITLRVIVLQSNLQLDGLEEVPLLCVVRIIEQLLHVRAHSSDCDLRHDGDSLPRETE